MTYLITKECEIGNVKYKPGDEIEETKVNYFPSVMKKIEGSSKAIAEKAKAGEENVLTKAQMLEEIKKIKFVGDLTDEQKEELKTITKMNSPELKVEYEKAIAEKAKAGEENV